MPKTTNPKPTTPKDVLAAGSKLDTLILLLQRRQGATMPDMIAATGWQAHSVRGAMAGALRKKGHSTTSEKTDVGRVWRIAPQDAG